MLSNQKGSISTQSKAHVHLYLQVLLKIDSEVVWPIHVMHEAVLAILKENV